MDPSTLIEHSKATKSANQTTNYEMHSIMIPPNRMTPLKNNW